MLNNLYIRRLSKNGNVSAIKKECIQDECAWWTEREVEGYAQFQCALTSLAFLLHIVVDDKLEDVVEKLDEIKEKLDEVKDDINDNIANRLGDIREDLSDIKSNIAYGVAVFT